MTATVPKFRSYEFNSSMTTYFNDENAESNRLSEYYVTINDIYANKPHRLRRAEAMGRQAGQTNFIS